MPCRELHRSTYVYWMFSCGWMFKLFYVSQKCFFILRNSFMSHICFGRLLTQKASSFFMPNYLMDPKKYEKTTEIIICPAWKGQIILARLSRVSRILRWKSFAQHRLWTSFSSCLWFSTLFFLLNIVVDVKCFALRLKIQARDVKNYFNSTSTFFHENKGKHFHTTLRFSWDFLNIFIFSFMTRFFTSTW